MIKVLYDSRWIGNHGIGRIAAEYRRRMSNDFEVIDLENGPKPSSPFDWIYVARRFRESQADVFFSPGYNGSPMLGSKQVVVIHDLIHFNRREPNGTIKRLHYSTIGRLTARKATVVTVSDVSASKIRAIWPEASKRVKVVPNGLSDEFIGKIGEGAENLARRGIVIFGNNRWHKNQLNMLRAISMWQSRDPSAQVHDILVIGNADKDLFEQEKIANTKFLGQVSDVELADIMHRSAALLFCSLDEGFGLPLLEALASGCPVVASDIAVFRDISQDGCVFVDPTSSDAIAAAIPAAINLPISKELSTRLTEKFNWDSSYSQICEAVTAAAST